MPPRMLRPRKLKLLGLLFLSCTFVAIGLKMLFDSDPMGLLLGLPSVVFFGLGALVFTIQLLPNASYLQLDPEGFTICTLFRARTFKWSEVGPFEVATIAWPCYRMVVFNFSERYWQMQNWQMQSMRRLSKRTAGHEGGLPDAYGLSLKKLTALLNEYRDAAQ